MGSLYDDAMRAHAEQMRGGTRNMEAVGLVAQNQCEPQTTPKQMLAFLTGSRCYPYTNTPPNDIDVVIPVDVETKESLELLLGKPCKSGNLNLILAASPKEYAAWKEAKRRCIDMFTARYARGRRWIKADAIQIHDATFAEMGIPRKQRGNY